MPRKRAACGKCGGCLARKGCLELASSTAALAAAEPAAGAPRRRSEPARYRPTEVARSAQREAEREHGSGGSAEEGGPGRAPRAAKRPAQPAPAPARTKLAKQPGLSAQWAELFQPGGKQAKPKELAAPAARATGTVATTRVSQLKRNSSALGAQAAGVGGLLKRGLSGSGRALAISAATEATEAAGRAPDKAPSDRSLRRYTKNVVDTIFHTPNMGAAMQVWARVKRAPEAIGLEAMIAAATSAAARGSSPEGVMRYLKSP